MDETAGWTLTLWEVTVLYRKEGEAYCLRVKGKSPETVSKRLEKDYPGGEFIITRSDVDQVPVGL